MSCGKGSQHTSALMTHEIALSVVMPYMLLMWSQLALMMSCHMLNVCHVPFALPKLRCIEQAHSCLIVSH